MDRVDFITQWMRCAFRTIQSSSMNRHYQGRRALRTGATWLDAGNQMRPMDTYQIIIKVPTHQEIKQRTSHGKGSSDVRARAQNKQCRLLWTMKNAQSNRELKHHSARAIQRQWEFRKAWNGSTQRRYEGKKHVSVRCDQGSIASVARQVGAAFPFHSAKV